MDGDMRITVGIKALNEERHIRVAIESALEAVKPFNGEVILADSGSSDRTVEIAREFDIRIVQLANFNERSCGAGAQLAFQSAKGEYFYLMDGDMVLAPDFVVRGIEFLDQNLEFAGVGGRIVEKNTDSQEFAIRANASISDQHWKYGTVDRLDCGGLYRQAAIRQVSYFADRNLHAFEEFELAARLLAKDWKLARIDAHAADHFGHKLDGYKLLWRRMRSGYSGGTGEVLRGAVGKMHLPIVLRRLSHVRNATLVIFWWVALLASVDLSIVSSPLWLLPGLATIVLAISFLSARRGSLALGLYSLVSWNVGALGLITGFFRARTSPSTLLKSVELVRSPDASHNPT
jgi:glycosyltransferase involved in cell wall biosynthesis